MVVRAGETGQQRKGRGMERYKIIRHYFKDCRKRTVQTGLTLEQAQAHCHDPETSCTKASNRRRTKLNGPWFDGYTEE